MIDKTDDLPGVEGEGVSLKKIKAIEDGFDALIGARNNRMKWGKKEKEAQASLIYLFHKHEIRQYSFDDRAYILDGTEKIRLKPKDEQPDEAPDEEL